VRSATPPSSSPPGPGPRWSTTVSSDQKAALATAAGAHHVVNYRTGEPAAEIRAIAPDGVDLVVDVAVIQNADLVGRVLKPRGAVSSYANTGGTELILPVRTFMGLNARLQFILLYTVGEEALRAGAEDVAAAAAEGASRSARSTGSRWCGSLWTRPRPAHDAVENGAVGKVLIDVADLD
jgi:NADPH2:quinone reductase